MKHYGEGGMILRVGKYKLRQGKVWLSVLIRVENSSDDEGRLADRPRLVLYIGAERHERPTYEEWGDRIWPCSEAEYRRISTVHTPETASAQFRLADTPPMF